MGDSSEGSSSEAPRHEDEAHPKQGFDELLVDYGTILILCLYEVHTMPSHCTILVLFLKKLDMILNMKTVLFMYDYSVISFHMMPVQFHHGCFCLWFYAGDTIDVPCQYNAYTMSIRLQYYAYTIYIQLQIVCH